MADSSEPMLGPETSPTPCSARSGENSSVQVGDPPANGVKTAATRIPLGSVLELTWLRVSSAPLDKFELRSQKTPLDLVLRWTAQASSQRVQTPPQSTKLSVSASSFTRDQWQLPATDNVARSALTPELLQLLGDPQNREFVLLHVSLAPRRSSVRAWSVSFTLAVDANMLQQCGPGHACEIQTGLCDQDGASVGVASVLLRWGQPSQLTAPPPTIGRHESQPVVVWLHLLQLKRLAKTESGTGLAVVLEISITGQEASRASRSRPVELLKPDADLSVENAVTLTVDDEHTQAIRLVVYRHSAKERSIRLAEALVSISTLESSLGATVVIQLLSSPAMADNRSDVTQDVWGELTARASVVHHELASDCDDRLPSAATSVFGASVYAPELSDGGGTLEIELVNASVEGQQPGQHKDAKMSVDVKLHVPSSKWTATTDTALANSTAVEGRLRFKQQMFSTQVQWAAKERVIPTLSCHLSLRTSGADIRKDTKSLTQSTLRAETNSNDGVADSASVKVVRGSNCVQLPVLFTYPDEWMDMDLPVSLASDDDADSTTTLVQLRIRVRLLTENASATQQPLPHPTKLSGHLTLSNARASGSFLKGHRPHDTYAIVLETSGKCNEEKASVSATADEKAVTWASTTSCEVVRAEFAPVLVARIHRILQSSKTSSVDPLAASSDKGEPLGMLSMMLPGDVLHRKHLVSLSLPFAAMSSSGNRGDPSARKAGMLSFDLQFIDNSPPSASRHISSVKLVVQHILWTAVPAPLALAIASGRTFTVQSSLSVIGGESLSEVLWSHDTPDMQVVVDEDGGYVVDHSIRLSDATIAKLVASTATKSMLIVKLHSGDSSRNVERVVLGQAVVPIRGGWAAFAELEQSKWHKLYEVGRRGSGNPEAIGEIQLSVVKKEDEADRLGAAGEERHERVDEWLYIEVVEAICKNSDISSPNSTQAIVQLAQIGSSRRPQRTKPQWSPDGVWRWNGDGVLSVPYTGERDGTTTTYTLTLVLDHDRHIPVTNHVNLSEYVQRTGHTGAIEDWLSTGDHNTHVRLRISYVPPVFGALRLSIHSIQSFLGPRASDLSIQRVAWRCAIVSSQVTATSEPKEGDARSLQPLEGSQLVLPLDSSRSEFASQVIPAIKLQVLGYAMGIQELCLGEASTPLPALLSALLQAPGIIHKEWITLHSRHDAAQHVAVAFVGFELVRGLRPDSVVASEAFTSLDAWKETSAAVLTLWKKLFYAIDSDHNGRVDLTEFKELFISHAHVFSQTQDGKMILRVLFPQHAEGMDFQAIERLFDEMDINGDKGIEWLEFVDFMEAKLLALRPQFATQVSPVVAPVKASMAIELRAPEQTNNDGNNDAPARELRRKRREDPRGTKEISKSSPPTPDTPAEMSSKRLNVRQLSAASALRSNGAVVSRNTSSPRSDTSDLTAKLESLQALLDLEKQKSARLQDEVRSLRHANHQLQMQRERELLEEKTKEQFLAEAIRSHEQALRDRDAVRAKHHTASIVLQSKVRMRLEQKKFQALRMQRWGAAIRIQCAYRCFVAVKQLRTLRKIESWKLQRIASAVKLQRFVRLHLRRKERLLHRQARALSAVLLQKCVRRWLAMRLKKRCVKATVGIQTWSRQRLAIRELQRLRDATDRVKHWLLGRIHRRRWCQVRVCVRKLQRWWRQANESRWEYVTQLEAAMCIQTVWRGHQNRQKLRQLLRSRHERERDVAQEDLMTAAMGLDREAEEEGMKMDRREEVTEATNSEKTGASSLVAQEERRQSEEDRDDGNFGVEDVRGDESAPPVDQTLDLSVEEDEEPVEPETIPATKSADSEGTRAACDDTQPSTAVAELTPSESEGHGIGFVCEEVSTRVAALDSENSISGAIQEIDAERSLALQAAEVLRSLIDRVLTDATTGDGDSFVERADVVVEESGDRHVGVVVNDRRSNQDTDTSVSDMPIESHDRPSAHEEGEDVESGAQAHEENRTQDEVARLVDELVASVGEQQVCVGYGDDSHVAEDDKCGGEVVGQVLRELVEAVAARGSAVEIPEEHGEEDELSNAVGLHRGRDLPSSPEDLADEVASTATETDIVAVNTRVDEDTAEAHLNGDRPERPSPIDSTKNGGTESAPSESFAASETADGAALGEEPEDFLDTRGDDSGRAVVHDHRLAVAQVADDESEIDAVEINTQAREERPEEEETLSTVESHALADPNLDERVDVRDDDAVNAEVPLRSGIVDEEPPANTGSGAQPADAVPDADTEATIPMTFDVSESDDEGDSFRGRESSDGSDDLQFMADADAVTHIQDAELGHEEPLDDQESRDTSERADSEQQMLLDLDELTQPVAAMTEPHVETNSGDQVVVADLD